MAVNTRQAVEAVRSSLQVPYPMFGDPDHAVASAYDVYDILGDRLAVPAVFVIDSDGHIVWSYIGQDSQDRPTAADILAHLP